MTRLPVSPGIGALLVVAALVFCPLGARRALAEDPPAPVSPAAPATAAPDGEESPATPASAAGAPAPGAIETAWSELHTIQRRQRALWKEQANVSLGLPAVGIALGAPVFSVMLPMGGLLVAASNDGSDEEGLRPIGVALISSGIIGLAAFVTGTITLARMRRKRLQGNAETRSLAERRSLLEDMVEVAQRAPTSTALPAASQLAPETVAAAWQELHSIRRREDALWREAADARPGLPATGVTLGIPTFGVLLPLGASYVARANSHAESGPIDERTRRTGATLIAVGALGFAALVTGTYMLVRLRRQRMQRDDEIRSLEERRGLLEGIVEADWRAARGG